CGEFQESQVWLRKVLALKAKSPGEALDNRRLLAQIQVLQGDYEETRRALADLEQLDAYLPDDPSVDQLAKNQRAKAVVLGAQVDLHKRQEAINILETMKSNGTLTANDRLLLARLYDSVGKWPRSRDAMMQLLTSKKANGAALVDMAQRFLRHKDIAEAEFC